MQKELQEGLPNKVTSECLTLVTVYVFAVLLGSCMFSLLCSFDFHIYCSFFIRSVLLINDSTSNVIYVSPQSYTLYRSILFYFCFYLLIITFALHVILFIGRNK